MPKIVDHAERRAQIALALWSTIYAEGISGVSFAAVARHGGISIGRIQHYFPTKRDLVLAGARAIVAGAEERFPSTADGARSSGDGADEPTAEYGIDDRMSADQAADTLRTLLAGQIPDSPESRIGSAVWSAYLAASIADREIAEIVLDAIAGTRDLIGRLAARVRPDLSQERLELVALRLSALRDGLAHEVLHASASPESARAVIEEEIAALTTRG